jgi:hypothetical protein
MTGIEPSLEICFVVLLFLTVLSFERARGAWGRLAFFSSFSAKASLLTIVWSLGTGYETAAVVGVTALILSGGAVLVLGLYLRREGWK